MEEVKKKKIATKKALQKFCEENNISDESVLELIDKQFPDKYVLTEELANEVIKRLFKENDSVTEAVVLANIMYWDKLNELDVYTSAYEEAKRKEQEAIEARRPFEEDLHSILRYVVSHMHSGKGDLRLSHIAEWTPELLAYIQREYTWSGCYKDGTDEYALGRAFNRFFTYWYFDRNNPPFHCHATMDGQDVLFTTQKREFIPDLNCYDFEAPALARKADEDYNRTTLLIILGFIFLIVLLVLISIF